MAIFGIVRASFQSKSKANRAFNEMLTGDPQGKKKNGCFKKVNTGVYVCMDQDEGLVGLVFKDLMSDVNRHLKSLDFLTITLTKTEDRLAKSP